MARGVYGPKKVYVGRRGNGGGEAKSFYNLPASAAANDGLRFYLRR